MNLLKNIQNNYKIILASKSPRRINLLKSLRLDFETVSANIDEEALQEKKPSLYCRKLAISKARFVQENFNCKELVSKENFSRKKLIIAADTIVVLENEIINKPQNEIDAFNILKKLSDRNHFVYTGIAVINLAKNRHIIDFKRTTVSFRNLSDSEIWDYINTGSPMDKAGAYGIQDDYGAVFVKKINGCYNNVIGLPLELLFQNLKKITR